VTWSFGYPWTKPLTLDRLKYATSFIKFSEGNGDITQEVDWNDIKVISAVFLDQSVSFDGRPAGTGSTSGGVIAPTKPA
jgi:hypothetical protein